jgi:hypothetical protein
MPHAQKQVNSRRAISNARRSAVTRLATSFARQLGGVKGNTHES